MGKTEKKEIKVTADKKEKTVKKSKAPAKPSASKKLKELDPSYNLNGFKWKVEAGINAYTTDRLHKIKAPTLIMAGELDFFISPSLSEQQLAKNIEGSRFKVIKDAAHAFYEEKPDEANKILLSFLTE